MSEIPTARLLFPALRWDSEEGFEANRDVIERGLELGVGGFVLFGGAAPMVGALTAEVRARAQRPLLIGSDLERGAGQQFTGTTQLPPVAALGALDDPDVTRRAAQITTREAMALGVNWIYAPVADVALEPDNPIVGTRAFGDDPDLVSRHVHAWVEGCRQAGGIACAKHFPGHGRTLDDSHAALPQVDATAAELAVDLAPFRAAIEAGVDTIMSAHVVYPALDSARAAATLSHAIITELLKGELGFEGAVVTDALIMQGVLAGGRGEGAAAVAAVDAGCDALLYPQDLDAVARALEDALGNGELREERVQDAIDRIDLLHRRSGPFGGEWGRTIDQRWAIDLSTRTLQMVRGVLRHDRAFDLVSIDDDEGGPFPAPSREPLMHAFSEAGLDVRQVEAPGERAAIIALYADIRAWKGRPGLSVAAYERLRAALDAQPEALVLLFGHPRLAAQLPGENVLAAWGGEAIMQRAAVRRMAGA